jgi:hypothetical protein
VGGKEVLCGRRFTSDDEVKEAVHAWLRQHPKSFFSAGIQELVERYNKRVVLQGGYVEKYVKLLTVTSVKAVKCFAFTFLLSLVQSFRQIDR